MSSPGAAGLVQPLVAAERAAELRARLREWPSWDLTPRQTCDLELLLSGGFTPLATFLGRRDHESVCASMRLADGRLWPIPVVLDLPEEVALSAQASPLVLRDAEGVPLAVLHVEEVWEADRQAEAAAVYETSDPYHPGVAHVLHRTHPFYASGRLEGLALPAHHDFQALRLTPGELRAEFARLGWRRVVAFQTRNPMHRAHYELTVRAAREADAHLLIHPSVGMTKPGDLDHYTRVRCYQALLPRYPPGLARLALLPLAMRMAGPREALWHALIRRNHGCTHFIVGRDHAGPGADGRGRPFYDPYAAQEALRRHEAEIGVTMVPFRNMQYVEELDAYLPEEEVAGRRALDVSGSQLRRKLQRGEEIPSWFTFPEVERELRATHPPRSGQGFTVLFTGLSGAGKSTIAQTLMVKLLERGGRGVTLLDGDHVRKHLSSELGFSRAHRDLNVRRIGFVAAEITRHGGAALCAPIAPYDAIRKELRASIEPLGGFVLVHVATALSVCEQRDRKGMYAKARAGLLPEFTGVSDPYEAPEDAEVTVDTARLSPDEAAEAVLRYLEEEGFLLATGPPPSPRG